jgi:hypothetical protein
MPGAKDPWADKGEKIGGKLVLRAGSMMKSARLYRSVTYRFSGANAIISWENFKPRFDFIAPENPL